MTRSDSSPTNPPTNAEPISFLRHRSWRRPAFAWRGDRHPGVYWVFAVTQLLNAPSLTVLTRIL